MNIELNKQVQVIYNRHTFKCSVTVTALPLKMSNLNVKIIYIYIYKLFNIVGKYYYFFNKLSYSYKFIIITPPNYNAYYYMGYDMIYCIYMRQISRFMLSSYKGWLRGLLERYLGDGSLGSSVFLKFRIVLFGFIQFAQQF